MCCACYESSTFRFFAAACAAAAAGPKAKPPPGCRASCFSRKTACAATAPTASAALNGAHDLTKSNLNAFGRTYLVTNGMGKMPAFGKTLTPAQVQQVVAYSLTLK